MADIIEFTPQTPVHPALFPFVDVDDNIVEKPRKLLFNLNALAYIERTTGRTIMTDMNAWQDLSMKDLRHFIYAGFRTDDPTLTLAQCGAIINMENMSSLFMKMMEAWNLSMTGDAIPLETSPGGTPIAGTEQNGVQQIEAKKLLT